MDRSLSDITAVELSSTVRAAYLGRLLADHGAKVTSVALPGAERPPEDRAWLERGKEHRAIDWRTPTCAVELDALVAAADVVVEDFGLPGLRARGVDPARWQERDARLIHVSLTDFGGEGPWGERPATDLIVSALSGMCGINGYADGLPLREPGNQAYMVAALSGFVGALAALAHRSVTGEGQVVDVSALEAMVAVLSPSVLQTSYQGESPKRRQRGHDYLFPCEDGWVSLVIAASKAWETLVTIWGIEADPGDERFRTEAARRANIAAMRDLMKPAMEKHTRAEIFATLSPLRIISGMALLPSELANDPHLRERAGLVEEGGFPVPGPSFRMVDDGSAPLAAEGE